MPTRFNDTQAMMGGSVMVPNNHLVAGEALPISTRPTASYAIGVHLAATMICAILVSVVPDQATLSYQEQRFRENVNKALESIRRVLDNTRAPQLPEQVSHKYDDKYFLAEFLTNTALAAQMNCLESLGLGKAGLVALKESSNHRAITLRFESTQTCNFLKQEEREVVSPTVVQETSGLFGRNTSSTTVRTKVTDYYWTFTVTYELFAYAGNDPKDKRTGSCEMITSTDSTPKPKAVVLPLASTNITWLLQHIDGNVSSFSIDRKDKRCHTPRRNSDISAAMTYFSDFNSWAYKVAGYFKDSVFPVPSGHGLDLSKLNATGVFVPVVPLFEEPSDRKRIVASADSEEKGKENKKAGPLVSFKQSENEGVLPLGDVNNFLSEQVRSLQERFTELGQMFPSDGSIITLAEAKLVVTLQHYFRISQQWFDGIEYIEKMLEKQLTEAIGKTVGPLDFSNYMRYHNRKLFQTKYEPRSFCYAIRQPDHYPEGTLEIASQAADGTIAEPIHTLVRHALAASPMSFPINAATNISFYGDRYVHAYVPHQFSGSSGETLHLSARARQFSCFILMVGRIASATEFEPKHAIIIQNRDDLKIPLDLEQIPTPKEFRDAIESLSPEQQRFAKAYRSMQLSNTLFGIVVIQIKPQLEKLLKLPHDSLTKEIRLTQDLLELFIKYQIPSDLLSYGGPANAETSSKIEEVKKHVRAMQDVIQDSKDKELEEKREKNQFNFGTTGQQPQLPPFPNYDAQAYESPHGIGSSVFSFGGGGGGGGEGFATNNFGSVSSGFSFGNNASANLFTLSTTSPGLSTVPPASAVTRGLQTPKPPALPKTETVTVNVKTDEKPIVHKVEVDGIEVEEEVEDYTRIPQLMETQFSLLDEDNRLRPTIINPGNIWCKKFQKNLLSDTKEESLDSDKQEEERDNAFDLLDALSRSGCLAIDHASLHVVVAATHCFDKTLMATLIQDNQNPIEKVERSTLIVASTVHKKHPLELVKEEQLDRVQQFSPLLFKSDKEALPSTN